MRSPHGVVGGWALKGAGQRLEASGVWNPGVRAASHQQGMRLLPPCWGLGLLHCRQITSEGCHGSPLVHRDEIRSTCEFCDVLLRLPRQGQASAERGTRMRVLYKGWFTSTCVQRACSCLLQRCAFNGCFSSVNQRVRQTHHVTPLPDHAPATPSHASTPVSRCEHLRVQCGLAVDSSKRAV